MHRKTTIAVVALALMGVATQPAHAAKRPTYKQLQARVRTLTESRDSWKESAATYRRQRNAMTTSRDFWKGQSNTLTTQKTALAGQIASLTSEVASLTTSNATLTTQRNQAVSGLSGEVSAFVSSATSASDIYNTILAPARAAWLCGGSTFLGSTFISVDFNRGGFCD
jgi:hypothetical protein